jgi:ribosomal protein S18 acetylase RimI-like enzyme
VDVTRLTQLTTPVSDGLAGALARAFRDDPFFVHVMADAGRRMPQLEWWMRCALRYGLSYGQVYATAALFGAAIWLPPDAPNIRIVRAARAGWSQAPWRLGLTAVRRLWRLDAAGNTVKKSLPSRRWYLMTLGVAPEHQSRGAGSALLQPVLAAADATNTPCFLETATTRDVAFYRKHGFEVVEEYALGTDGRLWAMVRPAP